MKIKEIVSQHRRDFVAIFQCEHCGYEYRGSGYDDNYYHTTVVPSIVCDQCAKTAPEGTLPREPKYPEGMCL